MYLAIVNPSLSEINYTISLLGSQINRFSGQFGKYCEKIINLAKPRTKAEREWTREGEKTPKIGQADFRRLSFDAKLASVTLPFQ